MLTAFAVNYVSAHRTNLLRILPAVETLRMRNVVNKHTIIDCIIIHLHQGGEVG